MARENQPDDSKGDPLVEEQTAKAETEAGAVGGNVDELTDREPGDPEMRPVVEGSGPDDDATLPDNAEDLTGERERRP